MIPVTFIISVKQSLLMSPHDILIIKRSYVNGSLSISVASLQLKVGVLLYPVALFSGCDKMTFDGGVLSRSKQYSSLLFVFPLASLA